MSTIWHHASHQLTLAALNERGKNTMVEWLGIELIAINDDSLSARMPVDHRTIQPRGILHGGASCVLAETVGSVAANLVLNANTHYAVGLSINTNHIRMATAGWLVGTARPIHLGRTTQLWQISIHNEDGQLISDTRLTMAVLNKK